MTEQGRNALLIGLRLLEREGGMTDQERDAILAGLRLLQHNLLQMPDAIYDIFTNSGTHGGLPEDEIDELCERINMEGEA